MQSSSECVSMFLDCIVAQTEYTKARGLSDHQEDMTSEKSLLHSLTAVDCWLWTGEIQRPAECP